MTVTVFSPEALLQSQQQQFLHDRRNHSDIICLPRTDRLKHYGLHFAKYVGRLARPTEAQSVSRTIVDNMLVCLSSANALALNLQKGFSPGQTETYVVDRLSDIADAAGRYADGCEKIDHLEEFLPLVKQANLDLLRWTLIAARDERLDLDQALKTRRTELADRAFYIPADQR